jgi:hypothetical protein
LNGKLQRSCHVCHGYLFLIFLRFRLQGQGKKYPFYQDHLNISDADIHRNQELVSDNVIYITYQC